MGRAYKPGSTMGGGKGSGWLGGGAQGKPTGKHGSPKGGFGPKGKTAGGKIIKERGKRFGKLVSEPDKIENGQYIPWARSQAPGSVKEVTFNAEGRTSYLTGFRKRKTERQNFAKKTLSTKETEELFERMQKKWVSEKGDESAEGSETSSVDT